VNAAIRKRDLLAAAGLGAAANFPWEMAHSLLYRGASGFTWKQHVVCCGLASLADGAAIAAIFAIGALAFRDPQWVRVRTPARLGITALLGFVGAAVTEQLALDLDWWGYGPAMPRVPGTELGISPLAQFVLMPLGVLFVALPRWWDRWDRGDPAR
jgi:hypothetical protein